MDDEEDVAENRALRACLQNLRELYDGITTRQYKLEAGMSLVRLALKERLIVEQGLRDHQAYSDWAPLALSAMQEALRTFVNPRASGFQVKPPEIRRRFGESKPLELWQLFLEHYVANVMEWEINAADYETTTEDIHAGVVVARKQMAPAIAEQAISILVAGGQADSVDAAVEALFDALAAEE